jgi:hypothetical protein
LEINLEANLFEHFFPSNNPSILTFMLATFFLSGIVKGFLGIGLPAGCYGFTYTNFRANSRNCSSGTPYPNY